MLILTHIQLLNFKFVRHSNKWAQLFLSGLLGSVLFTPFSLLIDIFLGSEAAPANFANELLDELLGLAPPVIFVWTAMNLPWMLGYRISHVDHAQVSEEIIDEIEPGHARNASGETLSGADVSDEQFYALLPDSIGRDIVYLEAELHYLKVVTRRGDALILFNIKDAVKLFEATRGFQCHRSYWIAKKHITSFRQTGRSGELGMSNGETVPVSKRKLSEFKLWAAGEDWLK